MTTPQITLKPLPCPCCRSASTYESGLTSKRLKTEWYCKVECEKCGVSIELFDASETREPVTEAAIAAWNTRHPERPDVRALEALIQSEKELLATINPEDHPRLYAMTFTRIRAFHETQAALAQPEAKPPFDCRVCGGKLGDAIASEAGVSWKCQECGHSVTGQLEAKGGGEPITCPDIPLTVAGMDVAAKQLEWKGFPLGARRIRDGIKIIEHYQAAPGSDPSAAASDTAQHQEMQRDGEKGN